MTARESISRRGFLGSAAGLGAGALAGSLATTVIGQTQGGKPSDDAHRQIGRGTQPVGSKICGPLRVDPRNPHYFTDDSGKSVYLAGVAVHGAFQDGRDGQAFQDGNNYLNYPALLEIMNHYHLNLVKQPEPSKPAASNPKRNLH